LPTNCDRYTLELFGLPCPPPSLRIANEALPGNVRLHWSTAHPEWRLQSANSLTGSDPPPFQNMTGATAIVGGRFSVTNAATGMQRVFRLAR
jgi:hypothetical protein